MSHLYGTPSIPVVRLQFYSCLLGIKSYWRIMGPTSKETGIGLGCNCALGRAALMHLDCRCGGTDACQVCLYVCCVCTREEECLCGSRVTCDVIFEKNLWIGGYIVHNLVILLREHFLAKKLNFLKHVN